MSIPMRETPTFSTAAVATPHQPATEAGRDVLASGGNAIEAMVAMAATIAVTYPHMNGLGGDGFWLIRAEPRMLALSERTLGEGIAIEACGPAAAAATIARYRALGYEHIPVRGPDAALTIAGTVEGWSRALEISARIGGRMPLPDLLAAAIRHARDGSPISASEARLHGPERDELAAIPGFSGQFHPDDKPPQPGDLRRQTALADTLDQLAHAGLDDFYRGDVAREIAEDLARLGSPIARADLAAYRAMLRKPLRLRLSDAELLNCPPPSQGLASLLLHGVFDRLGFQHADTFAHLHGLIEAAKRANAIRDRAVTDFDRLRHDPDGFLAPDAIAREAAAIDVRRAAPGAAQAKGDTVWMGAIDRHGLAVSFIQSIYWEYGAGLVLPRTGLLWQNRGAAFSLDANAANPLEPGRRPFHTLNAPMAVFDDGRVMSYGSMGGDGQPQFQAQVFFRHARFGQSLSTALAAPRFLFGRTWGANSATLKVENTFDPSLIEQLRRAGHAVEEMGAEHGDLFGHAGALMRHLDGRVEADHDPRADGGALGL